MNSWSQFLRNLKQGLARQTNDDSHHVFSNNNGFNLIWAFAVISVKGRFLVIQWLGEKVGTRISV